MDHSEPSGHSPTIDNSPVLEASSPGPEPILDLAPSPNPWSEAIPKKAEATEEHHLLTPDPSILDVSIAAGLEAEPESHTAGIVPEISHEEVLSEFDPLANQEEKEARDAWESSEAHPPPPRTPSPPIAAPIPLLKDAPRPPPEPSVPSSPSSFPSLAALARTFSIPTLARPRPLSLDSAKPVPSPATLSAFASQQDTARSEESTTRANNPNGSGTASPVPGGTRDKADTAFDFQKFLDQMKTKSAEPVAKYLRSYVFLSIHSHRSRS